MKKRRPHSSGRRTRSDGMMAFRRASVPLVGLLAAALVAQQAPPIIVLPKPPDQQQQQPGAAAPGAPAAQAPQQTQPATAPPVPAGGALGGLNFFNASLTTVIDILAQKLKINYILDPRVKGTVTINTYGEIKPVE